MSKATDANVKDPEGKEDPGKKQDLKGAPGATKDSMTEEEEAGMDATEEAKDADEEKADKEKDDKEARDRKSARDRRAGARDARKSARDRAKDARDKAAAADAAKGKGMDAAEVAALVKREVAAATPDIAAIHKTIRQEEHAKATLYGRISPIVGAFDHSEMTHVEMASYGLEKLGAAKSTDPIMALDYLLTGLAQASAPVRPRASAQDGGGESFMDKYLSGKAA